LGYLPRWQRAPFTAQVALFTVVLCHYKPDK
jgi:hypothetical protein